MCYIQMSLRINDKKINSDVDDVIKSVAINELEHNGDGSFIKTGEQVVRSMNKTEIVNSIINSDTNGLILHHRLATAGKVGELNIHGWHKGKWQFMHNGWSYGTGTSRDSDKSDSLVFFNRLIDKLDKVKKDTAIGNAIQKTADECEFRGRAVLVDTEQNKAFLFGDFNLYLINENYIVITSSQQDFSRLYKPVNVAGLQFEKARTIPFDVLDKQLDGIYTITGLGTHDVKFNYIMPFDVGYNSYGYTTTNHNRDLQPFDDDEKETINKDGDFVTEYDSEYGYYDKDGQFYYWDNVQEPDSYEGNSFAISEYDTDGDIAKKQTEQKKLAF